MNPSDLSNPFVFGQVMWPDVRFYRQQRETIASVWQNDETLVVAGNMLGKDYVAGFIALVYFLLHQPCRVITTSVKDDHLRVLWGEIMRYVQTAKYPLAQKDGGNLVINHRDIRKANAEGELDPISYLRGMVSEKGEGMAGHHAAFTLGIIDEASGVDDLVYTQMDTWAKKKLIFGNPNPTTNFFYKGVRGGDLKAS